MKSLFDLTAQGTPSAEIIVDLFAGGGGASEGIYRALGRHPDVAVNHDEIAVSVHKANHPHTRHFCEDIWTVSPTYATGGNPVGLLWASPDCTHFSKAKGGAPNRDDKIRSLALVIVDKWVPQVRPRVIVMENVEEMQTWGPLDAQGSPVKAAEGDTWRMFLRRLRRAGYKVAWREMRACDYGAPTIRKRLFLVARCDGRPIVWPKPTHGDPKSEAVKSGKLLPWRTAAECIDWSIPCPSIFATSAEIWEEYGVRAKRPLAEKTMRRIFTGIQRYVLEAAEPFIVTNTTGHAPSSTHDPLATVATGNHHGLVTPIITGAGGREAQCPPMPADKPLRTASTKADKWLVTPHLSEFANSSSQRNFPVDSPLRTQCAQVKGGHFSLVSPLLEAHYGGDGSRALRLPDIQGPLHTMSTENRFGLVSPTLVGAGGPSYGGKPTSPDKPLGTLMAENHQALCAAFLAKHFTGVVGAPLDTPNPTITTKDHNSLVAAHISKFYGTSTGSEMDTPLHTMTAGGANGDGRKQAVVTAHIDRQFGMSRGNDVEAPLGTTTGDGGGKSALVASNLMKMKGDNIGQDDREPLRTISAQGLHHAEVRAFLQKYYSEGGQDQAADDPMHTLTTRARLGLVTVHGEIYHIVDIGMRMLQPRELFRAQGFLDSYIIDRGADGRIITKTQQVRLCGNSVCPDMARALVSANVPELGVAVAEEAV
ncbi:MAG: DNA cytosine methyltransferase [Proteobacteria bacterium]|nr:DNA cytosine methyltransferase [Pseudomonadota bacterium]